MVTPPRSPLATSPLTQQPTEMILQQAAYMDDPSLNAIVKTNWQLRHLVKNKKQRFCRLRLQQYGFQLTDSKGCCALYLELKPYLDTLPRPSPFEIQPAYVNEATTTSVQEKAKQEKARQEKQNDVLKRRIQSLMELCSRVGKVRSVRFLLSQAALLPQSMIPKSSYSIALSSAALHGHLAIVKLFNRKFEENIPNDIINRAFEQAAIGGYIHVMKYLVQHGANINRFGLLARAVYQEQTDIVYYLVKGGVTVTRDHIGIILDHLCQVRDVRDMARHARKAHRKAEKRSLFILSLLLKHLVLTEQEIKHILLQAVRDHCLPVVKTMLSVYTDVRIGTIASALAIVSSTHPKDKEIKTFLARALHHRQRRAQAFHFPRIF